MAERRMFAKTIIDSDAFLDMPMSARLLYYDLAMRADDDGFVNSPKKIMKIVGATTDDLNILSLRKFILPFDSGVVVIKHWRIHNYIRKDTYNETPYKEELSMLSLDENKSYTFIDASRQLPVDDPSTQVRLGKDSIGKDSIENSGASAPKPTKHKYGEFQHVLLFDEEHQKLCDEFGADLCEQAIKFLDEYIEEKPYKSKSHYMAIRRWVIKAVKERKEQARAKPNNTPYAPFEQREYDYAALERELLGMKQED